MSLTLRTPSVSSVISDFDVEIDTYLGSTQFLKVVIPRAMATVLNRRCKFNPDYFHINHMRNVEYFGFRSIIPSTHCTFQLYATTQKVFEDLIVKKFLKDIFITIEELDTEKILEEFLFSFKYNKNLVDDSAPLRSRKAADQFVKFFKNINNIPDKAKYSEESIKIRFGCRFNETMPDDAIRDSFKPVDTPALLLNIKIVSSLKTNFHEVALLRSIQRAATPHRETAQNTPSKVTTASQESRASLFSRHTQVSQDRLTEIVNRSSQLPPATSPNSQEVADTFAENSATFRNVMKSEEFSNQHNGSDSGDLPVQLKSPKPKSKFVRRVLRRKMKGLSGAKDTEIKRKSNTFPSPLPFSSATDFSSDECSKKSDFLN